MHNYKAFRHPRNLVKFLNENNVRPIGIYAENGFITLVYVEV